ncbi:nucleoprotein TPR-like isoform X2 [Mya arenaria]|uniref:nucleoprotein TPR-like isoform X2 n=1 Tax=Mya arenaria TaxID=6604 RepID=UPI0022E3DC7C|nr:nucleoprotein TPR-like isoform X2 [Mya arenaria]
MAGAVELNAVLTSEELSTLSEEIKNKLNTGFAAVNNRLEELLSNYEKLKVNSEQQYVDVERQLTSTNARLETELATNKRLQDEHSELEQKYNEASAKLKEFQESQDGNLSTQLRLTRVNEQLECEKREMAVVLEKRSREIDTLNEELREMSTKMSEMNLAKCEALAKLDELKSGEVHREFQVQRLTQERDNLQQQVEWLNNDLTEKTRDLMTTRREKSTSLLDVQAQLEEKNEECSLLNTTLDTLKKQNADQAQKIDNFIQRIKDIQDSNSQGEEQYKQEISARIRLAELYKTSSEEAEAKSQELLGAVTELQVLLKDAAQAHTDMENEKNEEIEKVQAELREREKKIINLEQELVNANDLLSAMKAKGASSEKVEAMFPTAAVTSKVLKSGMSLTQIYNEYVQATDSLQLEKDENKRLNLYLDQILQEIEAKAPMLKKQREDYEIALRSIDQMTRQLDGAMLEHQTLRSEADNSHRKASHLLKENQKHEKTIRDLAQQVRYLVKEMEEVRGGRVVRDELSSNEISSSASLISDRLVTFGNIEELQEQNQKLLAVIRDLSGKHEEEENSAIDAKTRELKRQLEEAHEELGHMKDTRIHQTEMIESIVRQRDMYKTLLHQANSEEVAITSFQQSGAGRTPDKGSLKSPGLDRGAQKQAEESAKALKQLQEDFTTYKKDKHENEKIINAQLDSQRKEVADMRVQNARLSSQLEFAAERNKVSLANMEGYKKEIAVLRDKVQKYTASVAKHEQTINSQRQELMSVQEKLSSAQSRADSLQSERDIIKSSEKRLLEELECLRRERHSQTMLMANLQTIQNNLQRSEHETRHRLSKQIEALERERNMLQRKLEMEEKQGLTVRKHFQDQVKEVRGEIDQELRAHQRTKDQQVALNTEITELKQQLSVTTTKLAEAETRLADASDGSVGGDSARDNRAQLEKVQAEVASLTDQLHKARQHTDQYKTIADGLQTTISKQNKVSEELKTEIEEKLRIADQEREYLRGRVDDLDTERRHLEEENIRVSEESHELNAELRKKLEELQNELQEANERRETAIAIEMSAKQECDHQTGIAANAEDKYRHELMLHAADVEALSALKKEMEGFNSQLSEKEEKCHIAEQKLADLLVSSAHREKLLTEEKDKMAARLADLMQETKALHQQMTKLSNQVISIQDRAVASPRGKPGSSTTPEEDASKSTEQLLEVIRYIRKEKSIVDGKMDVIETECSRLRQRCEALERQLDSANKQLGEEREQAQAGMQTAAQHAELLHRVESYNLLHDSNKMLREERDRIQTQLTQTEAKLAKLEETIRPLQSDMRDMQAQRDALAVEKKSLTAEMDRWKNRTNQLIEQSHKTDPEEHKKLLQEKEEFRTKNTALTEELQRVRTDLTKTNLEHAKLQRQLGQLQGEYAKQSEEVQKLTASVEEKDSEMKDKMKTLNQLRQLGRKYKTQAEVTQKEMEELKAEREQRKAAAQNQQVSTERIAALEQQLQEAKLKCSGLESCLSQAQAKLTEGETSIAKAADDKTKLETHIKETVEKKQRMEEQVIGLKIEVGQMKAQISNLKEENSALKDQISKQTSEISQLKEQNSSLTEKQSAQPDTQQQDQVNEQISAELQGKTKEIQTLNETLTTVNKEKDELKTKGERCFAALKSARSKLESMKEINSQLTSERADIITKYGDGGEMKQRALEAEQKLSTLESQIAALTQEKENLQKENAELATKVAQLQSQVSGGPSAQGSRSTPSVAQDRTSSPAEPPKTANIRPISSSSPASTKPQTVPVPPQSGASKVTASIRPMTIPPVTTTCTPTATVMPTTVSQPDNIYLEEEVPGLVQQQLFSQQAAVGTARPTQQVHRLLPTPETTTVERVQEHLQGHSDRASYVEPHQSTSWEPAHPQVRDTPGGSSQHQNKRTRDESSPGEDLCVKRSKVTVAEVEVAPEVSEEAQPQQDGIQVVEVAPTPAVDQAAQQAIEEGEGDEDVENEGDMEETEEGEEEQANEEETQEEESEDDDAIIVVGSDDDDETQEEEDDEDDDNDDEEQEEQQEEDQGMEEEEEYEERQEDEEDDGDVDIYAGVGQEEENGDDGGQREEEEDDDVVIIGDDDDDGALSSQEIGSQPASQSTSMAELVPPIAPPERQFSTGGTGNLLAPFMLGSAQTGFEDMDDCTVPSTPTLHVPRHGDGFAEAIHSPQVAQRFVFGSGSGEQQRLTLSGLAQLENQPGLGMGMDDTRMDLSQLDEGSGRSVPSTPLPTSAPVTIITEAEPVTGQSDMSVPGSSQPEAGNEEGAEQEGEQFEEELDEEHEFEGEQGDEDSQEDYPVMHSVQNIDDLNTDDEEASQETGERAEGGFPDMSSSKEDSSTSTDKPSDPRPRIQRIVWQDPSPTTTATGPLPSASQPIQSVPIGQFRRGGPPRGRVRVPTGSLRGAIQGGFQQRGGPRRPMRSRGGGPFQRRPNMY